MSIPTFGINLYNRNLTNGENGDIVKVTEGTFEELWINHDYLYE